MPPKVNVVKKTTVVKKSGASSAAKRSTRAFTRRQLYGKNTPINKILGRVNSSFVFIQSMNDALVYCATVGNGGVATIGLDSTDNVGTPPSWLAVTATQPETFNNTAQFGLSVKFRFQDILQAPQFGVLFDSYKILAIGLEITQLNGNVLAGTSGEFSSLPELYHVNDFDDATPLANLNAALQYESCKRYKFEQSSTLRLMFKPKYTTAAFKTSGTTVGYVTEPNKAGVWLDMTYQDIEHYAKKFWVTGFPTFVAKGYSFRIRPIAKIACKFMK